MLSAFSQLCEPLNCCITTLRENQGSVRSLTGFCFSSISAAGSHKTAYASAISRNHSVASGGRGDLYVVVEVRTATHLTPRQRELLKEFKLETVKETVEAT